jgi:hypothetical protein
MEEINIKSHTIKINENKITIDYNKKFFKANKLTIFFYLLAYILFAGLIMSTVFETQIMTFTLAIELFLYFILSTFSIIKLSKEFDIEKKLKINKSSFSIDKNNISIIEDKQVVEKISISNIDNLIFNEDKKYTTLTLKNQEVIKLPNVDKSQSVFYLYKKHLIKT